MLKWQHSQIDIQIHTIPIRIPAGFFTEIDKLFLKFIIVCKFKGPSIAKTILKKYKFGKLTLPDFMIYDKAAIIKTEKY